MDKSIPIILGGYHASLRAEETIQNKEIDIIVRGEGEFAFKELVDHFEKNLGSGKNWIDGFPY